MTMRYLPHDHIFAWLDVLASDYEVFVPVKKGARRSYRRYAGASPDIVIGEVRATDPLKGFFTPVRETIAEGFAPDLPPPATKPLAIVGAKACDLRGFLVQDHVFCEGCRDPFYTRARDAHLILSADCTEVLDTCFCRALGVEPHPESHFDVNLSELEDGFLAESGSDKGRDLLEAHAALFQEADPALVEERGRARAAIAERVDANLERFEVPHDTELEGIIARNYGSSLWEEEARRCVECGACTAICPTCHCFLLNDQQLGDRFVRSRQWDSCMLKDYARVAGGGNARARLSMRLRNRFEKKFDFFPQVAGLYACTGCGRCVSACPAKIDIRRVLKRLVESDGASSSEPV